LADQIAKWSRRHRALVISAVALLAVVLLGLSVSTVLIWREQQRTRAREDSLRRHLYAAEMDLAQQAWEGGHRSHVFDVLERYRPRPGEDDLRRFEWYYLAQLSQPGPRYYLPAHDKRVTAMAFSWNSRTLASADQGGDITLWDPDSWRTRV